MRQIMPLGQNPEQASRAAGFQVHITRVIQFELLSHVSKALSFFCLVSHLTARDLSNYKELLTVSSQNEPHCHAFAHTVPSI